MAEYFLGLDFGTSGARACVLGQDEEPVFETRVAYEEPANPKHWRIALFELLAKLPSEISSSLSALAIDGTSGTLLATDAAFNPVSPALLYNDARAIAEADVIADRQFGPTSGLAKRLWLARRFNDAVFCFHQADWLAALLTGRPGITDYHNALKSGYDVEKLAWADWVGRLPGSQWQQKVLAPGDTIGPIDPATNKRLGINPSCIVRAGTTDSIAAFMAADVTEAGEAVTSLGTTMVLKLLSETRVDDAASGVYSHRYGNLWLAGGASNSGGGVLKQFFNDSEIRQLSKAIDPAKPTGLDYYPLPCPGERFPINDPGLCPRIEPRPADDVKFLQGLLEGMARIEAQGYGKFAELGASPLKKVITAGGGAQNETWKLIRQSLLGVPVQMARHAEASYGTAKLARSGISNLPIG